MFNICCADVGFKCKIQCFFDSSAAVGIVKRDGIGKARNLQTQFLWVQEMTTNNKASIHKVGTDSNPADSLTKYLDSKTIDKHIIVINLQDSTQRSSIAPQLSNNINMLSARSGQAVSQISSMQSRLLDPCDSRPSYSCARPGHPGCGRLECLYGPCGGYKCSKGMPIQCIYNSQPLNFLATPQRKQFLGVRRTAGACESAAPRTSEMSGSACFPHVTCLRSIVLPPGGYTNILQPVVLPSGGHTDLFCAFPCPVARVSLLLGLRPSRRRQYQRQQQQIRPPRDGNNKL